MSYVRFDHLPDKVTPGERAAVASADKNGWIVPPVYNSLRPEPKRKWRTCHLRYLQRRGFIAETRKRDDSQFLYRLNAAGLALR